jgi:hypothetical protein
MNTSVHYSGFGVLVKQYRLSRLEPHARMQRPQGFSWRSPAPALFRGWRLGVRNPAKSVEPVSSKGGPENEVCSRTQIVAGPRRRRRGQPNHGFVSPGLSGKVTHRLQTTSVVRRRPSTRAQNDPQCVGRVVVLLCVGQHRVRLAGPIQDVPPPRFEVAPVETFTKHSETVYTWDRKWNTNYTSTCNVGYNKAALQKQPETSPR